MPCQQRPQASSCRPRQPSQQRQLHQGRSGGIAGTRVVTRECRRLLCGPHNCKRRVSGCASGSTLPELLVFGLAHTSHLTSSSIPTIHGPEVGRLLCSKKARTSEWDTTEATPSVSRWDATPGRADKFGATPGCGGATPGLTPGHSRWDATPTPGRAGTEATPRRNRWDDATPTPGRVR